MALTQACPLPDFILCLILGILVLITPPTQPGTTLHPGSVLSFVPQICLTKRRPWGKVGQDFRVGGSSGGIFPIPSLFTGMREALRGEGPVSRSLKGIMAEPALALASVGHPGLPSPLALQHEPVLV